MITDFRNHPLAEEALRFATSRHASVQQKRKYTGEPYIVHPIEVASIVASVPHTLPMICAAYLHDVVEDTPTTLQEVHDSFGPNTALLVNYLSNISRREDGPRVLRKQMDRDHIAQAPIEAKTVKLADMISNGKNIAANDPEFSKVYMSEFVELLQVLRGADSTLFNKAVGIANTYFMHPVVLLDFPHVANELSAS